MAAAGVTGADGAEIKPQGLRLLRVWADANGESHLQELRVSPDAAPLPAMKSRIRPERGLPRPGAAPAWHNSPGRVFAVNLTGELECETSDGAKAHVPVGGIAFLEDVTGKGHLTRMLSPVTLLFLAAPDDFDVAAWAKGPARA